jgi:hypothetical protein
VVKADVDYTKAYTLKFVDKGVGLDLRPKSRRAARRVRVSCSGRRAAANRRRCG